MEKVAASRGIAYEAWRTDSDAATDVDQLGKVMRRYLACWRQEELNLLPTDLAATALAGREALYARSVMSSRAELAFRGDAESHRVLREMALTLNAAASRLSFLEAYNAVAP